MRGWGGSFRFFRGEWGLQSNSILKLYLFGMAHRDRGKGGGWGGPVSPKIFSSQYI